MKAISVKSPWWEKIVSGEKTIETRTWTTKYRGPLLICASQPKGMAVCIVELIDCRAMTKEDEAAACCPIYDRANAWVIKKIADVTGMPVKGQLGIFEVEAPKNCQVK